MARAEPERTPTPTFRATLAERLVCVFSNSLGRLPGSPCMLSAAAGFRTGGFPPVLAQAVDACHIRRRAASVAAFLSIIGSERPRMSSLSRDRVGGADYPRGFPAPPPRQQGSGEGWPREGCVTAYGQDRGGRPGLRLVPQGATAYPSQHGRPVNLVAVVRRPGRRLLRLAATRGPHGPVGGPHGPTAGPVEGLRADPGAVGAPLGRPVPRTRLKLRRRVDPMHATFHSRLAEPATGFPPWRQ